MHRTFNCGIGMVLVAAAVDAAKVEAACREAGERVVRLGEVRPVEGAHRVVTHGRLDL